MTARTGFLSSASVTDLVFNFYGFNMTSEIRSWAGRPSQWINLWTFAFWPPVTIAALAFAVHGGNLQVVAFIVAAVAVARVLWTYIKTRCQSYTLTSERFAHKYGVLHRKFHEVELYRVKDVVLDQPFWLRLVGLSNITIVGFDEVKPVSTIRAVRDGSALRETFRTLVETRREAKGVRVSESNLVRT
ncbi:PH domain-containing protein [Paraburkholderia sp. MM6662-R1]|uniref:PH domain-containing protein n=1 Tax=Paraburkholderia sp. MM6662-R1 TaxID=2991066 RepID=UPI003D1C4348